MELSNLRKELFSLKNCLDTAVKQSMDITSVPDKESSFKDFAKRKTAYQITMITAHIKNLNSLASSVLTLLDSNKGSEKELKSLSESLSNLKIDDAYNLLEKVDLLLKISDGIKVPESSSGIIRIPKKLPSDISGDVIADLKELDRCFSNSCYRSSVILCGRLLETALHRKYFETTGQDILEKNPGIGLGNLIAKLKEKEVNFEPGLTQQIHLINQARIFSVHKKQEPFYPSQTQTQAIILYTIDTLEKLF